MDLGLMIGAAASVCYLAVFLAAGLLAARRALPGASAGVVIPLGCGFGVSLLAALPGALGWALGFRLPAAALAGALAAGIGVLLWRGAPAALLRARPAASRADMEPAPTRKIHGKLPRDAADHALWACVLPLLAVTIYLLHTHILHLVDGGYHTGQSCYGDLALHLAYIKSIAVRGVLPPVEPMLAGDLPMGYPFLCESVSSVFLLFGAPLRLAYLLPLLPGLVAVYGMAWQLARAVLGGAGKACLAFWLFFMGSGFGFAYFLGSAADFASIFTGYYTTPTNYTDKNILWVNPVVDLLVPQRATLLGWCVLFPALYLLWRFAMQSERRLWPWLAALVLPLPLLQTHSALALVLCCLVCGVYTLAARPKGRPLREVILPWAGLALICGVIWLPETLGTVVGHAVTGENMLRLHFNWSNNPDGTLTDNYFWFYIKNIGLVFLLLLPAFVRAKPKQRWFYGGGLAIWALAECVVFQTNLYDNNKLLYIWHLLGCILVANLLVDLAAVIRALPWRAVAMSSCCFLGMFGSVLTFGRELLSDYGQWSAGDIALAAYVDENAAPDALFVTSDSHLAPVCSLAGRQILCGSATFLYFHGLDYSNQYNALVALYTNPDEATLAAWGVDYVVFDASLSAEWAASETWYAARYPLWYEGDGGRIYAVSGESAAGTNSTNE